MPLAVLPGTLEMLALKALSLGTAHGFGVLQRIQRASRDTLLVEQGALYPALHRLEAQGLVSADWGVSDNNRRAKFYAITSAGKKRLNKDLQHWRELVQGMDGLLNARSAELIG